MTTPTWDRILGPGAVGPERSRDTGRWAAAAAIGEEALTFVLTFVAMVAAINSIERADWVEEMPNLSTVGAMSLIGGWMLARSRLPGWIAHLLGVGAGLAYVVYEVAGSLVLESEPGVAYTWEHRVLDLWTRNGEWLHAARSGEFSTDPIPFVVLVVFATWALAYLAAWAIARWRNPWLALVPGAIALLTNISYLPGQPSADLIVFLFASILLFARLHMLGAVDRLAEANSAPPQFLSLEVLSLATWVGVGLIIVAWMIPTANHWGPVASLWSEALAPISRRVDRIGQLFIGVSSKRATGLHQFEGVLPLQGTIALGATPLLSVDAPAEAYLTGAVYDQYTSNGWKLSATSDRALSATDVNAAQVPSPALLARARMPMQATVHVTEDFARDRSFFFGEPLASDVPTRVIVGGAPEDIVALAPVSGVDAGGEYRTVGSVSVASADRLITSSGDYPAWVRARYLQLPAALPNDVRILAQQVAGDERVPYNLALRMEDYLRRTYQYTLETGPRSPQQDSVEFFLFDRRQGYSDYFASAMAVMLRTLGVPSRVAVGFALNEADRDPVTKEFVVSDQQAWVWPQVYFQGYGWVDFNPTPSRVALTRPGDDTAVTPAPTDGLGGAAFEDPNELDVPAQGSGGVAQEGPQAAWSRFVSRVGTGIVVLAGALLVIGGVGRLAWDAPFRNLSPATRRWAKLQTLAHWAGVRLRTDRTPLEEAAQLGAAVRRPPLDLTPLARGYVVERYGRVEAAAAPPGEDAEIDRLYVDARSRLLRRAVSRFFSLRG
jgi:transglutaminase-like putative cysteine protease